MDAVAHAAACHDGCGGILEYYLCFPEPAAIPAFCLTKSTTRDTPSRRRGTPLPLSSVRVLRELHELIEALDRRVPQIRRVGEPSIARDAAALRVKALKRIAELEVDPREVKPAR